tara:strand:- start:163 stop:378 length:216 start_codon:yes stop_codon:yes gene_type:complete
MRRKKHSAIGLLAPQLVALVCFLIINASNPYLGKFDYLWTIFLPIASINAISLNSRLIKNNPVVLSQNLNK